MRSRGACRRAPPARLVLVAVLAGLMAPLAAGAACTRPGGDLHVGPQGNDAGPGTDRRPLRSVQRAADLAIAGTTVYVDAGDYGPVVSRVHGRPKARITYRAAGGWAARIRSEDSAPGWVNLGDHVDVIGFRISAPAARHGVTNEGSHVRIVDNRIDDVFTSGPCTAGAGISHERYDAVGNEATGNLVHDIGPDDCALTHGIYVSNAAATLQNNIVYRVAAWCIHTWHGANRVTIANNLVFGCGSTGGGILVGAGDRPEGNYASDFVVTNNIVVDSAVGISEAGRVGAGNRYANNLLFRCAVPLSLWSDPGPTLTTDPHLVDYRADGTGDYRPQPSSPAIDAGTALGAPTRDRAGVARPTGPAVDIGPYESR